MGNLTQLLGQSFDASEVPQSEYEILPEGDYVLQVADSELKITSKGGVMLVFTYSVVGSQYDGRQLKDRLNIQCDNEKAVEIAFQTLAKIVQASGMVKIDDSSELHGKKFLAHVVIKKGEGTYMKDGVEKPSADQNVIKKYTPIGAQQSTPTKPQASATQATAPATGAKKMPWAK